MPQWLMDLLVTGGLLAAIIAGVGTVYKAWREDRKAKREELAAERAAVEQKIDKLQAKVESLLMDAIAREKERNKNLQDRLEMDAKQNELLNAVTTALKDATLIMGKKI